MYAWQFMKMLAFQEANGLARFVSMQNHYNLAYREEEREMLPLCRDQGIAVTPWSPLARGLLAGTAAAAPSATKPTTWPRAGTTSRRWKTPSSPPCNRWPRPARAAGPGGDCLGGQPAGHHPAADRRLQAPSPADAVAGIGLR
jgi:hypothetical protein